MPRKRSGAIEYASGLPPELYSQVKGVIIEEFYLSQRSGAIYHSRGDFNFKNPGASRPPCGLMIDSTRTIMLINMQHPSGEMTEKTADLYTLCNKYIPQEQRTMR